jgi:hypothetical protein
VGGAGDDTYWVDDAGDNVLEAAPGGTDTVFSSVSRTLMPLWDNVENLVLVGSGNLDALGNAETEAAAEATGAPKTYRPHDARRRWVTELHRAGVPLKTISHLVGHADVQTTERYLCTYYDDPAVITAPTPGAVAAFSAPTASVIPMRAKASR